MERSSLWKFGVVALLVGLYLASRLAQEPNLFGSKPQATPTPAAPPAAPLAQATKLITEDLKVGTGTVATPGKSVTVHYRGTLTDGTKFDASYDHGQPFTFMLGRGEVIK